MKKVALTMLLAALSALAALAALAAPAHAGEPTTITGRLRATPHPGDHRRSGGALFRSMTITAADGTTYPLKLDRAFTDGSLVLLEGATVALSGNYLAPGPDCAPGASCPEGAGETERAGFEPTSNTVQVEGAMEWGILSWSGGHIWIQMDPSRLPESGLGGYDGKKVTITGTLASVRSVDRYRGDLVASRVIESETPQLETPAGTKLASRVSLIAGPGADQSR